MPHEHRRRRRLFLEKIERQPHHLGAILLGEIGDGADKTRVRLAQFLASLEEAGVEDNLAKQPGPIQSLYKKAREAWQHLKTGVAAGG